MERVKGIEPSLPYLPAETRRARIYMHECAKRELEGSRHEHESRWELWVEKYLEVRYGATPLAYVAVTVDTLIGLGRTCANALGMSGMTIQTSRNKFARIRMCHLNTHRQKNVMT